jgi:hypothetical protein
VLNATFSSISAISWRPGLVVQEAGNPEENYRYLDLCVVFVDHHLSYCPISLGHYIVCDSLIDLRLLLPLWYLQTFLVLSYSHYFIFLMLLL